MAVIRSATPGFNQAAHREAVAATPDLAIKSAAEAVVARRTRQAKPVTDVPIRGNAPSVPMPKVTRTVIVRPGYVAVMDADGNHKRDSKGKRLYKLAAGYVRDSLDERGVTTRSTFTRRWSKKGRTSQTAVYRGDSFVKRGIDGLTGKPYADLKPGSARRVGNVPSTLVPEPMRETAGLMSPGDDVEAIEYGRKGRADRVKVEPWVAADPKKLRGPILGPVAPLGSK